MEEGEEVPAPGDPVAVATGMRSVTTVTTVTTVMRGRAGGRARTGPCRSPGTARRIGPRGVHSGGPETGHRRLRRRGPDRTPGR